MGNNILVFAEQRDGVLKKVAYEMLSAGTKLAADLGGSVEAVLLGSDLDSLPEMLAQYGATKVYVADDPALEPYSSEAYTDTLAALVAKAEPAVMLLGATAMGKDLAPRLAACLGVGVASDCTALEIDGGQLLATRPIFAGKALAQVKLNSNPQMATVRPNVLAAQEPEPGASATVEPIGAVGRPLSYYLDDDIALGGLQLHLVGLRCLRGGGLRVRESRILLALTCERCGGRCHQDH